MFQGPWPREEGDYLPTMPGTHMEFCAPHLWTLDPKCRVCRVMRWLRMWNMRDKHIAKRHRPSLTYISPAN